MKRLVITLAMIALPFTFAGCDADTGTYEDTTQPSPQDPGGIGMTYNGKLGYDYGGGFVQPFDGSAPSFGYGL